MKKILLMILLVWVLSFPVKADTVYTEQIENSGAQELSDALPPETAYELEQNGIDLSRPDWVGKLSAENVFSHIFRFLRQGAKTPLAAGGAAVALMLVAAAFPDRFQNRFGGTAQIAATLGVALTFAAPTVSAVQTAAHAVRGCGVFMLSFVPVFAGICVASGGGFTAVSAQVLLSAAAQVVVSAAGYAILPLSGSYLAMNLCAGVSPLAGTEQAAETVRKIAVWALTLLVTVFVGILGIQTAVQAAADSLALKTTKFIVGTTVPVAGVALSEATSTLYASLGLLRSSVGAFGVVATAAILLPILAEMLLWRLVAAVCGQIAAVFSQASLQKLFKAVDQMFSLLTTVVLLTGAVFIIALSVVLTALRTL